MTDWTEIKIPGAEVFWIEEYILTFDVLLGMPVSVLSEGVSIYLERGMIRKITKERAQELNENFAAEYPSGLKYLEDALAARWLVIGWQIQKAAA